MARKVKKDKVIQGRRIDWQSNAKIAQIRVHGQKVICTHSNGVVTEYPVKEIS